MFLAGEFQGRGSLMGCCLWGRTESDTTEVTYQNGFPGSLDSKASAYNAGDPGPIPGSGRSLGEGNGNPLQYSCLENPMDRGAWWATVHGVAKSRTQLSDFSLLPYAQKVQTTNCSFFNWRINALQCYVSLCSTTV